MRKHATRRWLAGIGVVGVCVVASATPAPAAPASPGASPGAVAVAEFATSANNVTLAPAGPDKTVVLRALARNSRTVTSSPSTTARSTPSLRCAVPPSRPAPAPAPC